MRFPPTSHHNRWTLGSTVPITVGLAVTLWGLLNMVRSFGVFDSANHNQETNLAAMYFIGGLFFLLTGVWFMTRGEAMRTRIVGLGIMVTGVFLGNYMGTLVIDKGSSEDFSSANLVFLLGLLVHVSGVIYVTRARE